MTHQVQCSVRQSVEHHVFPKIVPTVCNPIEGNNPVFKISLLMYLKIYILIEPFSSEAARCSSSITPILIHIHTNAHFFVFFFWTVNAQ